jgi:4'-phosphopantetheinyl transferase
VRQHIIAAMGMLSDWRPSPRPPALAAGDVHVWRIPIGAEIPAAPAWLLSSEEQARAQAFRHDADRSSYVRAHAAMRVILSVYVRTTPAQLEFKSGPFGKPSLASEGGPGLEFNLSHSHDLALLAVCRDRQVGVDIARRDPGADHAGIAERMLSAAEREALLSLQGTPDRFVEAFYSAWTRKEAYVKATGGGLAQGVDHFDVSLAPAPPKLIADRRDAHAPARWTVFALDAGAGYSAALVVANPVGDVVLLDAPASVADDAKR